ncbi:hypothetical protein [Maribellus sp. CM-23]|nr:hypothetical protein [Maribellus sp. CM-23]
MPVRHTGQPNTSQDAVFFNWKHPSYTSGVDLNKVLSGSKPLSA